MPPNEQTDAVRDLPPSVKLVYIVLVEKGASPSRGLPRSHIYRLGRFALQSSNSKRLTLSTKKLVVGMHDSAYIISQSMTGRFLSDQNLLIDERMTNPRPPRATRCS